VLTELTAQGEIRVLTMLIGQGVHKVLTGCKQGVNRVLTVC